VSSTDRPEPGESGTLIRVYVGIDVATDRLNCVAVDKERKVLGVWLFAGDELDELVNAQRCRGRGG
jgi:hypothetical protein